MKEQPIAHEVAEQAIFDAILDARRYRKQYAHDPLCLRNLKTSSRYLSQIIADAEAIAKQQAAA